MTNRKQVRFDECIIKEWRNIPQAGVDIILQQISRTVLMPYRIDKAKIWDAIEEARGLII